MSKLPECPKCRGPSVPRYFHPLAGDGEACERFQPRGTADQLRCLACGWRFRASSLEAALDALEVTDGILQKADRRFLRANALEEMGAAHRKQMAIERAKYERAMRGEW